MNQTSRTCSGAPPSSSTRLCTLRNHCRQWPRNTRYQADATAYLGRTLHRLDRTSFRLAHSLDQLISACKQRRRYFEAELLRGFEVDDEFELGRLHHREVGRLGAIKDFSGERKRT